MNYHIIFSMLVVITALAAFLNERYLKLPKTIALTVISVSISVVIIFLSKLVPQLISPLHNLLSSVNFRTTVLDVMLGYLLFAGSLHLNSVELKKNFGVIIYLASVGVVTSTIFTGFILWNLGTILDFNLTLASCLVFGAIISPTDPIAVMGILKGTSKVPAQTKARITGESLFNDAVGILLVVILTRIFLLNDTEAMSVNEISLTLVREVIGGIAWGGIVGYITYWLLTKAEDHEVTILLTLATSSSGYIMAQYFHVSGAITMVVAGLLIGNFSNNNRFNKKTTIALNQFWGLVDGILNAFLFILIGLELLTISISLSTVFMAIIGIIVVFIARFASMLLPSSVMVLIKFRQRSFDWAEIILLCWGGVRGGISIALAYSIPNLPSSLVTITYLLVIFSILFQGSTLKWLVNKVYIGEKT